MEVRAELREYKITPGGNRIQILLLAIIIGEYHQYIAIKDLAPGPLVAVKNPYSGGSRKMRPEADHDKRFQYDITSFDRLTFKEKNRACIPFIEILLLNVPLIK